MFLAPNHKANFIRMQVGQDAFFRGCDFHGLASFVLAKWRGIGTWIPWKNPATGWPPPFAAASIFAAHRSAGSLRADKAQFLGHISDFEAVQVGHGFHANGAVFAGSVYFTGMAVKDNFFLDPFRRA